MTSLSTIGDTAAPIDEKLVAQAVWSIRDAGYAILPDILDVEFVGQVKAVYDKGVSSFLEDLGGLAALHDDFHGPQRFGAFPPLLEPFTDAQVVANPTVIAVLRAILGTDMFCNYYNSNTSYPGSVHQRIHRDHEPLFAVDEVSAPLPAHSLAISVPLCDFDEVSGSTEVWPGTHHITGPLDLVGDRVSAIPSIGLHARVGSVLVRDTRLWHRGVPNRSNAPRTMLSIVYSRSWLLSAPLPVPPETWEQWGQVERHLFRYSSYMQMMSGGSPIAPRRGFELEPPD